MGSNIQHVSIITTLSLLQLHHPRHQNNTSIGASGTPENGACSGAWLAPEWRLQWCLNGTRNRHLHRRLNSAWMALKIGAWMALGIGTCSSAWTAPEWPQNERLYQRLNNAWMALVVVLERRSRLTMTPKQRLCHPLTGTGGGCSCVKPATRRLLHSRSHFT